MQCALKDFDEQECGGRLHWHHILNRGKLTATQIAYCHDYPHLFLIEVCAFHNVTRMADSKKARAYLVQKKIDMLKAEGIKHAEGIMEGAIDMIPWKVPPYELSYKGIMCN